MVGDDPDMTLYPQGEAQLRILTTTKPEPSDDERLRAEKARVRRQIADRQLTITDLPRNSYAIW